MNHTASCQGITTNVIVYSFTHSILAYILIMGDLSGTRHPDSEIHPLPEDSIAVGMVVIQI